MKVIDALVLILMGVAGVAAVYAFALCFANRQAASPELGTDGGISPAPSPETEELRRS